MDKIIYTFSMEEEDKELPSKVDIEWLDQALELADIITARILQKIERRSIRLATESILKIDEPSKP